MAFALAFDAANLYMGINAVDDTHQNPGSGWNGDTLQIAFTNAARDAPSGDMILYNYGLNEDGVTHTLHHQRHPCPDTQDCTEAAMMRFVDTSTTVYEIKIPVRGLGVDTLTNGMAMGFGMCLNDGDLETGQDGQKGWTGWGPDSIVYGKNSPACGLITIRGESVPGATLATFTPVQYTQDQIDAAGIENADLAYNVYSRQITLDAVLDDWDGIPILAQTPFRRGGTMGADANGATGGGPWCEFDEYNGGIHNGVDDQSMSFALAFTTSSLYMGINAVDDTHQNPGSGWNGDTVQIAFTNAARDAPSADMILYNYGLNEDGVSQTVHHQSHPCPDANDCTEAAMLRYEDISRTVYEIKIP